MTLDQLEALCRGATPGPYLTQGIGCEGPHRFIRIASSSSGPVHGICKFAHHNAENNAAYFTACSPDYILKLIRVARASERHVEAADSEDADEAVAS